MMKLNWLLCTSKFKQETVQKPKKSKKSKKNKRKRKRDYEDSDETEEEEIEDDDDDFEDGGDFGDDLFRPDNFHKPLKNSYWRSILSTAI